MLQTTMSTEIGSNDVLCGRGGATNNHPGNKRFRAIVAEHMHEYLEARKKEKAIIAKRVLNEIRQGGGRFLTRSPTSDVWVEVSESKAVAKTSQALREGLDVRHKTYRPSKIPRRDSDSSSENPRKRTRRVEGKVVDSPRITGIAGLAVGPLSPLGENNSMPELKNEISSPQSQVDPLMIFFGPPSISNSDCEDIAAV